MFAIWERPALEYGTGLIALGKTLRIQSHLSQCRHVTMPTTLLLTPEATNGSEGQLIQRCRLSGNELQMHVSSQQTGLGIERKLHVGVVSFEHPRHLRLLGMGCEFVPDGVVHVHSML